MLFMFLTSRKKAVEGNLSNYPSREAEQAYSACTWTLCVIRPTEK